MILSIQALCEHGSIFRPNFMRNVLFMIKFNICSDFQNNSKVFIMKCFIQKCTISVDQMIITSTRFISFLEYLFQILSDSN